MIEDYEPKKEDDLFDDSSEKHCQQGVPKRASKLIEGRGRTLTFLAMDRFVEYKELSLLFTLV